jgi:hypothetical protein
LMRSHYIKQELVKLIANFTGVVLNVLSKWNSSLRYARIENVIFKLLRR